MKKFNQSEILHLHLILKIFFIQSPATRKAPAQLWTDRLEKPPLGILFLQSSSSSSYTHSTLFLLPYHLGPSPKSSTLSHLIVFREPNQSASIAHRFPLPPSSLDIIFSKSIWYLTCCFTKYHLTLSTPAYFGISGTGGGHIVPPLSILELGWVRVPILFGNNLPMND